MELDQIIEAIGIEPYYREDAGVIYCADCMDILPKIPAKSIDLVLTDPPYPNNANHFNENIKTAKKFISVFDCNHWFIFWDEMTEPPCNQPLVAKHIWHRTNTNRPDNYEMIYEYNSNNTKKASRAFPFPVIYPGLTGCFEASGHPTQKNIKLLLALTNLTSDQIILDPFLGSGTTAVAAKQLGRQYIGIEISEKYCEIAVQRLAQEILL